MSLYNLAIYISLLYDVAVQETQCCVIGAVVERYRQMWDSEKIRTYQLRQKGMSFQTIADTLSKDAEDGRKFNRATILRVCRSMPDSPSDQPFEWHRLEEYGLPWEASEYLLKMACFIQEFEANLFRTLQIFTSDTSPKAPPTVRQARWWWRVHQAVSDAEGGYLNVYIWAEEYVRYELYKDILDKDVDVTGLDAYLTYRPWFGEQHLERYTTALDEERIPSLPNTQDELPLMEELERHGHIMALGRISSSNPGEAPIDGLLRYVNEAKPLARELRAIIELFPELQRDTDSNEVKT
jgi:hypothetical protein